MEAHDRHKNVVISGTPGVGKSTFRNDVVHCLVQKMKRGGPIYTVVQHSSPGPRSLGQLIDGGDGADGNLFYLLDVSEGNSQERIGFAPGSTVMFTSPNQRAYHAFLKQDSYRAGPLFMPLWEREEAAARFLGASADTESFQLNWHRYGGVPRLLVDAEDPETIIDVAT
jgi:hypothetical protein